MSDVTVDTYMQSSLPSPVFVIEPDQINKNRVVVTANLQSEFFDVDSSDTEAIVAGTVNIRAKGARSRGQLGFFYKYSLLSTSEPPTSFPIDVEAPNTELSIGAEACICGEETWCKDSTSSHLSYGSRDTEICIM